MATRVLRTHDHSLAALSIIGTLALDIDSAVIEGLP